MATWEITGKAKIEGKVKVPGARNAALPMLCASLLTREKCIFKNVPRVGDVENLLNIFKEIGVIVACDWEQKTVEIQAQNVDLSKLQHSERIKKMRASILLTGPLLARFGEFDMPQPGCGIPGARSNKIHASGLKTLGAEILQNESERFSAKFAGKEIASHRLIFSQASVMGTENIASFAAGIAGNEVEIFFAATEPHVCATLKMLQNMGAGVLGIGSHFLKISGKKDLQGGTFTIPSDGILAANLAIAAILTGGNLQIEGVHHGELFTFYGALKKMNVNFKTEKSNLTIATTGRLDPVPKVQTGIFPAFPADLQGPISVLLTQCEGCSMVFETLFESHFAHLFELEKMGAKVEVSNPHQIKIFGKQELQGREIQSWDLQTSAATVLAGLCANGKTIVRGIDFLDRCFENLDQTLNALGAKIKRI